MVVVVVAVAAPPPRTDAIELQRRYLNATTTTTTTATPIEDEQKLKLQRPVEEECLVEDDLLDVACPVQIAAIEDCVRKKLCKGEGRAGQEGRKEARTGMVSKSQFEWKERMNGWEGTLKSE